VEVPGRCNYRKIIIVNVEGNNDVCDKVMLVKIMILTKLIIYDFFLHYMFMKKTSEDFKPLCLHAGLGKSQLYFIHTVIKELLLMVLIQ